jgi:hypothetical protein
MSGKLAGATALFALAALAACSDATGPQPASQAVQLATGSTGGGGGGGSTSGGGGGGSVRPCAILSYAILNNVATGTVVPSFWGPNMYYQAVASGTAEKSCDAIPNATITFEDMTGNDGCTVMLTPWVNNPAYLNPKYGAKPMSRYQEGFIYFTGPYCVGRSRVLKATLTDPSVGGRTTSVTLNWTP